MIQSYVFPPGRKFIPAGKSKHSVDSVTIVLTGESVTRRPRQMYEDDADDNGRRGTKELSPNEG